MTQPMGPACDICKAEPSVMSVMNLADHEQLLIGSNCLLGWCQGMVGMLTGAEEDAESAGADQVEPSAGESAVPPADPPEAAKGEPGAARAARPRRTAGKS